MAVNFNGNNNPNINPRPNPRPEIRLTPQPPILTREDFDRASLQGGAQQGDMSGRGPAWTNVFRNAMERTVDDIRGPAMSRELPGFRLDDVATGKTEAIRASAKGGPQPTWVNSNFPPMAALDIMLGPPKDASNRVYDRRPGPRQLPLMNEDEAEWAAYRAQSEDGGSYYGEGGYHWVPSAENFSTALFQMRNRGKVDDELAGELPDNLWKQVPGSKNRPKAPFKAGSPIPNPRSKFQIDVPGYRAPYQLYNFGIDDGEDIPF